MPARKSNTADRIRKTLEDCGLYEERLEHQINITARVADEIDETEKIIKKAGRTITQTTYSNSMPTEKLVEHPLLGHLRALYKDMPNQYAALGLNKNSEKKAEPKRAKEENDPTMAYFSTING